MARNTFEVADMLSVDVATIRKEISRGKLVAYKVGKNLRIDDVEIEAYKARNRIVPRTASDNYRAPRYLYHDGDKVVTL